MDNHDVISSLFYTYYFFHGKSNPRHTLMLIQLITCVGLGVGLDEGCPTFFQFRPNFISSQSWWVGRILLQFLNFCPKIQVFSKKKGLLESCSYRSISAPNVFQQSCRAKKLKIITGLYQNLKFATGLASLG